MAEPQPVSPSQPQKFDVAAVVAQQNFPLAAVAGILAALAGAVVWAVVVVSTKMVLGIMALAVGVLVGKAVRFAGKGVEQKFGILAAVCALLGSLLGGFLSFEALRAQFHHQDIVAYILQGDPATKIADFVRGGQPMDLLFYAIAVYEAYKFAFKYRLRRAAQPPK